MAASLPRALVLTAGLGTRLRPLTYGLAKAAVPVNGEPLARRVVTWLAGQGVRDLVLNLHHEPESIAAVIGDGSDLGARVRYSWEQPVLGSAGGPRRALPLLCDGGRDVFLLINGDTLTDLPVGEILAAHARSAALVTMAVIPNPRPARYGGVAVAADGAITGFTRPDPSAPSYHFIGVQAASARAFADLPDGVAIESVGAVYPRLMRERPGSVRAFVCGASFRDIGTPADCLETSLALASTEGDRMISPRARIAPTAAVTRTALWDDVSVGDGASLRDCIVAAGVAIPGGTRLERCAVVRAAGRAPRDDERVEDGLLVRDF